MGDLKVALYVRPAPGYRNDVVKLEVALDRLAADAADAVTPVNDSLKVYRRGL